MTAPIAPPHVPAILQSRLPVLPWMTPALWRLPGIQPLAPDAWIEVDDAYAAQMREKARLIAAHPTKVHAMSDASLPAAREVLDLVLQHLSVKTGFRVTPRSVIRPDGVEVALDRDAPLLTLGALVQEDICLLQKDGDTTGANTSDGNTSDANTSDGGTSGANTSDGEHMLTAALLCFPASWTLAEKIGRPLTAIHAPVRPYDDQMARRVQRLFDAIRPEQPLWRMNALLYADPTLHQPKSEAAPRQRIGERPYLRSEKQCLLRLPVSGAVVFSIHTYVVPASTLTTAEHDALRAAGH